MNIKIKVINQLTNEVEIDSQIDVTSTYETIENNHEVFRRAFPDCQVNFFMDDNNFICSPAYNMEQDEIAYDEGRMTWKQYCDKWYKGALSGCNEDESENDFKFTFETEAELWKAQATGYIDEYDCVRVEVKHPEGGSTDFPVKSREELANIIERHGSTIVKIYPTVHSYDIADYL